MKRMSMFLFAAVAANAILPARGGDSAPFLLDTADGTRIATEGEAIPIAYSPRWGNAASCTVDLGGSQFTATEEGSTTWTPQGTGGHTLTHTAGSTTYTAQFAVLGNDVETHGGTILSNETWGTNKVHLVVAPITLGDNDFSHFYRLEIQSGAIVKFMPGTGLSIESNAYCSASGSIFTHVNDDTIGGDTLMDGDSTSPVMDDYQVPSMLLWDDTIEFRYRTDPNVTLSGTISEDEIWRGHNVYCVTGNLTVASGKTLTIMPGAIVKFSAGLSLTVNGRLDAQGTRAQPIVFTSIKDDEYGGDTNGDGEKTRPDGGDWRYIYVSGTANMKYCKVLYGAPSNETGILETTGSGVLNMDCCYVAHALYDGIWNWGGSISVKNTIITDTGWATAPYRGSKNEYINCIFYQNNVGMCYWSNWNGNPVYKNCVFTECGNGWCELGSGSYGDPSSRFTTANCLFWNPAEFGAQSCGIVGSNGNIWGDPKFVDAENGDFRIQKGSPCINAGDAANAPDFDYYGQPRDAVPDIGIYESVGMLMNANDLATDAINCVSPGGAGGSQLAATVGDTLTISYSVANVGKQSINGSWRDKFSLVSTDGGYSIDLGTIVQSAALAVGATNTFNASFTVPTDAEGTWRVQVGVNVERDIYEGANVTNNVMTSEGAVEISLPARAAADGFSGTAKKGAPATAKFTLDGTEAMVARIDAPAGTVVYLGSGFMPSASSYSARAVVGADGGLIGIPVGVTTAYLMVETASSQGAAFTMTLESAALAVQSVTPATLPYTGTTGLVIDGANFAEGCTVELGGPASVPAMATTVVSPTRMTAQIDCSRLVAGATYDVKVIAADATSVTLPRAVTVAKVPAAPKLKATLDAPASVRRGRTLTVYIDYENVGNADMPAPVFELVSEGQVFKIDGAAYTNSVKVMGLSSEAPVGTLRPGEPQRIGIPVTILAENVKWKLKSYHAAQAGAKKKLQLEAIYDADWIRQISAVTNTSLYASVKSKMGDTWDSFYCGLGAYADVALSDGTEIVAFRGLADAFMAEVYESVKSELNTTSNAATQTTLMATPRKSTMNLLGDSISTDGAWLEVDTFPLLDAKYAKDNSNPGDVWWWRGSGWFKPKQDEKTDAFASAKDILLICHGNANSIHENWIQDMAQKAIATGRYKIVLAVDWGDHAFANNVDFAPIFPELTAPYIPVDAAKSVSALRNLGVRGSELTVVGHSHGGHYAGHIANALNVSRLIGLDSSPMWTHGWAAWSNPLAVYPSAWNFRSADVVEFYKSSWQYSMGTDPTDQYSGDIFGWPSFFTTQAGDFFRDAWRRGEKKVKRHPIENVRSLGLHGYAHEWFRNNIATIIAWDWSDANTWKNLSGYDQAIPERGQFAGVLRGVEMECGAKVKNRVAESMGVAADSVDWLYDRYVLGKDIVSHSIGVPAVKSPASSLPILQERWLRISEHGLNSFAISGANSSGVYELGGHGVELTMFIENYANNLSVDYNHSSISRIEKPWQRGFGHLILVADVTDAGSAVSSVVNDVRAAGGASRLSWEKVMQLQNAGLKFAAVNVEGGGMMNEDVFLRPVSGSIRHDYSLPLPASVFPSGKTDDEEPRDAIVLGIVGVNANTWRKNGSIELYEGELCADNNCIVRLIKVKPKGPSGEVMSGRALEFYWSATQVSAFAPENIQDDNTWTADENGNWTVTLTGATSYGPTNIVAGSWTGFDCTVSQREWTPNPNVTVTGHLFTGEDGDFVPAQDYTVILAVEDANGKIGTKEYKFTIKRHVDEDPGEDEDAGGSNEPKSCDPNEMVGEEGVGEARFVKPGQELTYTIYFENKSDADAAAACVEVFNPLNEWLDWSSLTMLDVGYNNNVDNGLGGLHEGVSEKAMDGTNVSVRTEFAVAYYDEAGNELDENALAARSTMEGVYARAEWYLRIIDPNGDSEGWPLDMTGGFLPPNNEETHCGEGYIRYKVKVRDDAPGNVVITNSATIIFDHWDEDALVTDPAWWNTVRSPGAQFSAPEVVADEGGAAEIRVSGGNAESASSVKVYLTYNTAVAADVDVAKGAVSDATERVPPEGGSPSLATAKGVKSPLLLTWEKGEIGEKVITIPVKTDKAVEGDEFFTLQLAEAEGMELGEERVCTVTIRDTTVAASRETLQDAVNNAVVKMSTSGKGKWAYANVGTGGEAEPGKTASASAASPILKAGEMSELKAAAVKGSGTLTFDVRVANPNLEGESPEVAEGAAKTVLTLLDGKVELLAWTNETDWTSASYTVEEVKATSHAFTWRVVQGTDTNARAYVANVVWSPAGTEMRAITPSVEPAEGGTVAGSGVYPDKTKLSLVATAKVGYEFIGWYDGETLFDAKAKPSVTVTNDLALTARFEKIPYVRGLADPADGGKVSGSGLCAAGKKVTLKAAANKNFMFLGWMRDDGHAGRVTLPGDYVATTASLVIDRSAKPAKDSKTSTTITNIAEDVTYFAVFKSDPKVSVAVEDTDEKGAALTGKGAGKYVAGTITGEGKYAPGKKVTLKATANKGYVFAGWVRGGRGANALPDDVISQAASLSFTMPSNDVEYVAMFVTAEEDKGSIALVVSGEEMRLAGDGSPHQTNVWAGVYLEWPVAASALSETKVKVAGLPSGLKFTDKPVTSKIGSGKTAVVVTNVPANTIYGAPTAASKTDKDGNVTPSTVKVTVTTAGKSSQTFVINLYIDPLPAWAVGTFDGYVRGSGESATSPKGLAAVTVSAAGKISGKILEGGKTWTLSAAWFDEARLAEDGSPHLDPGTESPAFVATVIGKAGKEEITNEVTVAAGEVRFAEDGSPYLAGVANGRDVRSPGATGETPVVPVDWTASQNLWKRADTKAAQPLFKKTIDKVLGNGLKLIFKKDGVVSFAGKLDGTSVSGSSQLVSNGEKWQVTLYAPQKGTFKGYNETIAVTLTLDAQNVVTAVYVVGGFGKVQLWEGGPYWATMNIGAEKPEDYGYYFWWGDTVGYKRENTHWVAVDGSSFNFAFESENTPTWHKSVTTLQREEWITTDGVLAPEHDAAQVQWGGGWRMPTDQELYDLCYVKCIWTRTTMNDVKGYIVCGRGDYASNSIFLPAAGGAYGTSRYDAGSQGYAGRGFYWSSVPYRDDYNSWYLEFITTNYIPRCEGLPIRPVQSAAE